MIELLVSLGADACAPDALGATPLHVAAACGNASALAALLRCASSQTSSQNNATAVAKAESEAEVAAAETADAAAKNAAAKRCHAGLTPLEVALTRRRDARELFASMLAQTRAFDVEFGPGPMGITLALVRHAPAVRSQPAPHTGAQAEAAKPEAPIEARAMKRGIKALAFAAGGHRRLRSDGLATPTKQTHRRTKSHDDLASGESESDCDLATHSPRTLLVSSVSNATRTRTDLEAGDQLLALNGILLGAPNEFGFPLLTKLIKSMPRPIRATFACGSFPHLSVEDDDCIDLLRRFSPPPKEAHSDACMEHWPENET